MLNVNYLPPCIQHINNWCDRVVQSVSPVPIIAKPQICPAKLDDLTNLLARDLPSYANRIIQQRRKRTDSLYSSLVTVSIPDLQPIELVSHEYPARFPQAAPKQVFLSSLENQYTGLRSTQLQQFHWLFIAQTQMGWRLVNIYTRTSGSPGANIATTPPIESSKTIIGEAIRIWLNDCYLGKIRS